MHRSAYGVVCGEEEPSSLRRSPHRFTSSPHTIPYALPRCIAPPGWDLRRCGARKDGIGEVVWSCNTGEKWNGAVAVVWSASLEPQVFSPPLRFENASPLHNARCDTPLFFASKMHPRSASDRIFDSKDALRRMGPPSVH